MSDLGIIHDGALVIEDGIITRVGKTDEVIPGLDETRFSVINAAGRAVLPGFVDSHTHFVFGGFLRKRRNIRDMTKTLNRIKDVVEA